MTREWTLTVGTTERALDVLMRHAWSRVVVALTLIAAAIASPVLARGVSAASANAGPGQTLVYQTSWQDGRLDWTAHSMTWSVSHGILRLRPTTNPYTTNPGWIVAPYRPTRSESFAIEAVMRFSKAQPSRGMGGGGWVDLIAHSGPPQPDGSMGAGVAGRYQTGGDIKEGALIVDSAALADYPTDELSPGASNYHVTVSATTRWHTYRLEVRTGALHSNGVSEDSYSFKIDGVQVVHAVLGDWMQYNRIALSSGYYLDVKSLKVYRLH